jgi:hypothetical protein
VNASHEGVAAVLQQQSSISLRGGGAWQATFASINHRDALDLHKTVHYALLLLLLTGIGWVFPE